MQHVLSMRTRVVVHASRNVAACAGDNGDMASEVEGVEVEMLITPERLETVPTRAATAEAPEADSAPEGAHTTLAVQAPPPVLAEGSAEINDSLPAPVTKPTPAPEEVASLAGMHPALDGYLLAACVAAASVCFKVACASHASP